MVTVDCRNADSCRYVIVQSLDTAAEKLCIAEACVLETSQYIAGMLTRPAGHEAKTEAEVRKSESEAEAEARHVREQLSVYDIVVQNIVFSKQPIHNKNDCRWLYSEY